MKLNNIGDQECRRTYNEALREAIAVGLASGPDIPADEVFDRLEAKYLAMAEAAIRA